METNESLETCLVISTSQPVLPDENHPSCIIEEYSHAKIDPSRASRTFPRRPRCRASMRRRTASCRSCRIKHSQRSAGGTPPMTTALTVSYSSPSPTVPRKFAVVDWGSRKEPPTKHVRSAGLELPPGPIGCSPRGSAMKWPLYYQLCAIRARPTCIVNSSLASITTLISP